MNDPIKTHYETLLAKCYSRAMGGFEARAADNAAFFQRHGIAPGSSGRAADLGAGSGFQTVPLARAGFSVTAVDFSDTLLEELRERARGLDVSAAQGDIRQAAALVPAPLELAVCMGDTLSHLAGPRELGTFFASVRGMLEDGGRFILSYRNQETALTGADRFLPVCSGDDLLFTCALEYGEEHITACDLVWFRDGTAWRFEKSCYRKTRLRRPEVDALLVRAGFSVEFEETVRGMVFVIARKNAS